jgi:hypothetical protein
VLLTRTNPRQPTSAWRGVALAGAMLAGVAGCTPPIRQYDIRDRPLTCAQANTYTLRTLQSMGFTLTAFQPAAEGRPGVARAWRTERDNQSVQVDITCRHGRADVFADEEGKWLNQIDFRRGFHDSFVGVVALAEANEQAAREAAARGDTPAAQGLRVLLAPVPGPAAQLDFEMDFQPAGVLPVRVTIDNGSERRYRLAPEAVVLVDAAGARVRPLALDDVVRRLRDAPVPAGSSAPAGGDAGAIAARLRDKTLVATEVGARQQAVGFLFFPAATYVKGRVSLEDVESEEAEGVVVEF